MKKTLKKALAFLCAAMVLTSSVITVGAVEAPETTENKAVISENIPTEMTTKVNEATEALDPITTESTSPVVKREKKNLNSTGANIATQSTGATSASGLALAEAQTLTSAKGEVDYATDINGKKVALTVVKTRYATSNGSKYTYQSTNSKGETVTLGKPYKIVITCDNGAGDGSLLTATWTVDESTITSTRTEADGKGTLSLSSGVTTAANKTTRDWSSNGVNYTPWGIAITNSKITNVEIGFAIRTIGKNSFRGLTDLKSITFKKNSNDVSFLKKIDEYAFCNCDGLTSLTLNGSNLNTVGAYAFYSCNGMKTLKITSDSLVTIGAYAFTGCACTSLNLTISGLTTIGERAFQGCDTMQTLTINATNLKTMADYAFYDCNALTTITMTAPALTKIETYTFRGCDVLKTVNITANNLTSIGKDSFYGNPKLTTVTLTAGNLKTLNTGVFQNNPALVTVTINADKLTALPEDIFRNSFTQATNDTSMVILRTASLKTIGAYAFKNCTALEVVRFTDSPIVTIGSEAFRGCSGLLSTSVHNDNGNNAHGNIPSGSVSGTYSNILTLPRTVKTIESLAFAGCSSIEVISHLKIGNAELQTIGESAFRNMTSLHLINLPNSVQTIESNAFRVNTDYTKPTKVLCLSSGTEKNTLTGVSKLSQLKYIGALAFSNSISVEDDKNGNIPKGLRIFDRSTGKTVTKDTVFIFHNVTEIKSNAFTNNTNLVGQFLFKKNVWIAGMAFLNTNLTNIYCKYDGYSRVIDPSTATSSQIGSSDVYVSTSNNFAIETDTEKIIDGVTYYSLYHILTNNIDYWRKQTDGVGNKDILYSEWAAEAMKSTEWSNGNMNVPYQTIGEYNGTSDNKFGADINPVTKTSTSSFLQTEVEWITPNKTAKETVTFGYKNPTCVDYIFVVDTSGSMDAAANTNTGESINGSRNVSKVMTALSQVYDISERVLSSEKDNSLVNNTVSIITFSGNKKNELKNSSKFLGTTEKEVLAGTYSGLKTQEDVYNALFKNDDGYESTGTTNWSSGLSRAYMMIEGLRRYNKTAGIENNQVVIFLTDGSPTYANGSDENAGGFSPIYTENEGETALENGTTKKNPVMVQVNGVDWAKAIKGDPNSDLIKVRDYDSSYYDPNTDTLDSTTQSVKCLGVQIFGILIGNTTPTKKAHLNKVTSPDTVPITKSDISKEMGIPESSYTTAAALDYISGVNSDYDKLTFTSSNGHLDNLAKNLVYVVSSLTAEDYVVTIPLDNNFNLLSNSNNKVTITTIDKEEIESTLTDEEKAAKTYSFTLSENWKSNLNKYANYGRIRYDKEHNRILWDLSDYLQDGGTTSSSFVTYQLTFNLQLQSDTTLTRGIKTNEAYYSVCTNNPETSLNTFVFNNAENVINGVERENRITLNSVATYTEYVGAYAYINGNTSLESDPTELTTLTEDGYLAYFMNYAKALYLPVVAGGLNLYKQTEANKALTGSEFQVYTEDGELLSFYKNSTASNQYSYYDTTFYKTERTLISGIYKVVAVPLNVTDSKGNAVKFADIAPSGTNALASIVDMPPGTYYLYESKYPDDDYYDYIKSELDNLVVVKCADGIERECYEVVVAENTTVSTTIHNKASAKSGRIIGYKVDQNGDYLAGATIGLYDSYPSSSTAVLLDTYETLSDGKYIFNVTKAGTYYIKEISAPEGYRLSTEFKTVTFTEEDLNTIKTVSSNIVNYAYAKIVVHVDSSDYTKENFEYSLTTNFTAKYTGATNEDGTYTFYVPHLNTASPVPFTFKITQTSAPNDYYLTPEYSLNGFDDTVANTGAFTIGSVTSGSETHVYVYNPSVKVAINNYDGDDKTTPLQSGFTLNDMVYETDENGTFTADEWFGYGNNTLVQTNVPMSYSLLAEPVTVNIASNNIKLAYDENGQRYYQRVETVYNSKKLILPLTGGNGNAIFMLVSVLCLGTVMLMAVYYIRRKGKVRVK